MEKKAKGVHSKRKRACAIGYNDAIRHGPGVIWRRQGRDQWSVLCGRWIKEPNKQLSQCHGRGKGKEM